MPSGAHYLEASTCYTDVPGACLRPELEGNSSILRYLFRTLFGLRARRLVGNPLAIPWY